MHAFIGKTTRSNFVAIVVVGDTYYNYEEYSTLHAIEWMVDDLNRRIKKYGKEVINLSDKQTLTRATSRSGRVVYK